MWALIPLKTLCLAKQRLSTLLSPAQRQQLSLAMFSDILAAVGRCKCFSGVVVIADDPEVEALVAEHKFVYLQQGANFQGGLNEGVAQGFAWLNDRGVNAVAIIHADLPLLGASELEALVTRHKQTVGSLVTLVPDSCEQGTNVMLLSGLATFDFAYGEGSFRRHYSAALAAGAELIVSQNLRLGLDIDFPSDLLNVIDNHALSPLSQTAAFLAQHRSILALTA